MNKKIFSACLITLCIISLYVNYQYTKHIKGKCQFKRKKNYWVNKKEMK